MLCKKFGDAPGHMKPARFIKGEGKRAVTRAKPQSVPARTPRTGLSRREHLPTESLPL